MMKHEFEKMVGKVEEDDYVKIETVYMYYPGIETKEQIAAIYKIGMIAIMDLFPRADELRKIEAEIIKLRLRIDEFCRI